MAYLTNYDYIGRSSAMSAPNGANYYLVMYAGATPNKAKGTNTVKVGGMLACTENSSFYGYNTTTRVNIGGKAFSNSNEPNSAWSTTPITDRGITYKKWYNLEDYSVDIDCSDGKDKEIDISITFEFNENSTDTYVPAAGTRRTVSATVLLKGVAADLEFTSITSSTKYLDSTITCKYKSNDADYYIKRDVYLNVGGNLTTIRSTNLGKKAVGAQTSDINLSDEELSKIYSLSKNTTATLRVTFRTYNDSAYTEKVGSAGYKEISLTLPLSVNPTVALDASPASSLNWISSQGIYVTDGVSSVKFTITGEAGEGAALSYTSITTPEGATTKGSKFTINFSQPGSYKFTATAVDSRGRTATATKTITVLSYDAPSISMLQAERGTYDSKWTAGDKGADVRVIFKAKLQLADNGNTYSATFKIDGSAATPAAGSTTSLKSGAECIVYFKNVDGEKSHRLALTATDRVGETMAATITLPTSNVTIEYNVSGKGVSFGKPSEKNALECAWPAYIYDDLFLATKIGCLNPFSLRDFNVNCYWADNAMHDMIVRINDGLTLGLGWSGNGDDGESYNTVLDVRPKQANFRGTVTAPRGRFTATNDSSGTERKDVALRLGDADGQHMDMDTNEIQAKEGPTVPGPLYLNLDGGDVYAGDFKIPQIQRGSVTITPTAANTPTSFELTFPKEFSGTPTVIVSMATSVPGTTVLGVGVNSVSKTGCKIWATRTNTTDTVVNWIAVY
jgi:hypothetical protein